MPAQPELTQVERDKLTINPDFDFKQDIAQRALADITPNELAMFKWSGIYQQLQPGFFMMRLRIPGGVVTADQLDCIADVADTYAQGEICITTRMTVQFHWLRKDDLWKVHEAVAKVGLDSKNACGDVTRNIVTCPLQGVCPHEIGDVRAMIQTLAEDPELKDEQRNLPRKHKIAVNGCGRACGQTLMNDQAWHPVRRGDETGWMHYAGGGLGARPFMGKLIFDWVPSDLVLPVTQATTEVYRRYGNRRVRAFARLKFIVDQMGVQNFGDRVIEVLQERGVKGIERLGRATNPPDIGRLFLDGQAVIPQRQAGLNTVRLLVPRSEMTGRDARLFAQWARTFGDGTMMLTARQNIQFRFVPDAHVQPLLDRIHAAGFSTEGFEQLPDMVACVGTTQCNLAVGDTPNAYRRLCAALAADQAWWRQIGPLKIHMNGCPNSCAQHWIADLGLRGMRKELPQGSEEGFQICVGGGLDGAGHIAMPLCEVALTELVPTVRRILQIYLDHRRETAETFSEFARRIGVDAFAGLLGVPPAPPEAPAALNQRLQPVFDQVVAWAE